MDTLNLKVKDVSDKQLHCYRFRAKNHSQLTGRLFINDLEIHHFTPESNQLSCADIHYWLMPGENHITIAIEDAPNVINEGLNPLYACSLHGMTSLGIPDDHNCLWKIEILDLEDEPPLSLHYKFNFSHLQVPSSDLWSKAEAMSILPEAEQNQIVSLKENLVSAFKAGDTEKVMGLYQYVIYEEASMNNKELDESLTLVEEEFSFLSEMTQQGHVKFEQTDEYYFNHLAGNRVIQLCSDSGGPAIKMIDDAGDSIGLNIYASKIEGEWNLVRR